RPSAPSAHPTTSGPGFASADSTSSTTRCSSRTTGACSCRTSSCPGPRPSSTAGSSSSCARGSCSPSRWNGPEFARVRLVALLLVIWALPCAAGETFLDRSKVREAVPYGTTIEPPPPEKKTTPPPLRDQDAGRPSSSTSSGSAPGSGEDERGRHPDRR